MNYKYDWSVFVGTEGQKSVSDPLRFSLKSLTERYVMKSLQKSDVVNFLYLTSLVKEVGFISKQATRWGKGKPLSLLLRKMMSRICTLIQGNTIILFISLQRNYTRNYIIGLGQR